MKILVADDHTLFREGLRHVLAELAERVEIIEAGNCEEALAAAEEHDDLALVLLDLHMPGRNGFAALDTLARERSALPIVVLSGSENRADMRRAIDSGAMGYIPKSASAAVMVQALRLVLAGGLYVPPALIKTRSRTDGSEPASTKDALGLTPRQFDVLRLVIEGKSNKIIAAELGLTERTVKSHITAVFKALEVSNRTQAALMVERLGIKLARN